MFAAYNQRGWYRLIADLNKVKLPQKHKSFEVIREQLMKFKPLRSLINKVKK